VRDKKIARSIHRQTLRVIESSSYSCRCAIRWNLHDRSVIAIAAVGNKDVACRVHCHAIRRCQRKGPGVDRGLRAGAESSCRSLSHAPDRCEIHKAAGAVEELDRTLAQSGRFWGEGDVNRAGTSWRDGTGTAIVGKRKIKAGLALREYRGRRSNRRPRDTIGERYCLVAWRR